MQLLLLLLCFSLVRYLYPTDNELRQLAGIPKDKAKGKKAGRFSEKSDVFRIPRSLDVQVLSFQFVSLCRRSVQDPWLKFFFRISAG